jgi:hypothetical protein
MLSVSDHGRQMSLAEFEFVEVEEGRIIYLLGPDNTIETKLLPGFKLDCRSVLEAGQERDDAK